MKLRITHLASPLSPLLLATDAEGKLRAMEFADLESRMHRLLRVHYGEYTLEGGSAPTVLTQAFDAYFAGKLGAFDGIATETAGTPFQREVWRALRAIPAGQTVSYGQLATKLGREGASRAVGAANGANPISIVVPCHRVIGGSGTLTGYAGGIERKKWLLNHEERFALKADDLFGGLRG